MFVLRQSNCLNQIENSLRNSPSPHKIELISSSLISSSAPQKTEFNCLKVNKPSGKCSTLPVKLLGTPTPLKSRCVENNSKLTQYFPVRRSVRRSKKTVQEEIQKHLEEAILTNKEEGLQKCMFKGKGRGVVAVLPFFRGQFVLEYAGELITRDEALKREQEYAQDQNTGCYMYYFKHLSFDYCVDATAESNRLGRLVNHSRNGNLTTKVVTVDSTPHLVLIAKEDIKPGEEVTYDYGDRSKESLQFHPWLAI